MKASKRDVKKPPARQVPKGASPAASFLASPPGMVVVAVVAVVAVAALIAVGGGLPAPTEPLPTGASAVSGTAAPDAETSVAETAAPLDPQALLTCAGQPCPSLGREDAPVTIVEVSDFSCSHCRDFHVDVVPFIERTYVESGQVRFVSHAFGFNAQSQFVAIGALCAAEQDRYFEFQRLAFEKETAAVGADVRKGIEEVGKAVVPDYPRFEACIADARQVDIITRASTEAAEAGVTYTPTIVLDGEVVEGALTEDLFRELIDAALEANGAS